MRLSILLTILISSFLMSGCFVDTYMGPENVGILTETGDIVSVQNPFSTNGDSIYGKDIDTNLSSIGTFDDGSTDILDLFKDIPVSLIDNSSTSVKYFVFTLERPIEATQIAMGCQEGNFSNVKILFRDLSNVTRAIVDDTLDDTKYTSNEYNLGNPAKFGSVKVEFHTTDEVCVGFVFIQKDTRVISRLQGLSTDNSGVVNIKASEVGALLVADFKTEIARGNIPGYSFDRKFGAIDSIQASTPADVWAYGITSGAETYTFSADNVSDIDRVSSDSSLDAGLEITIIGLDINGAEVIQTIELNSIDAETPVNLSTSLWRVNRAFNANGEDLTGNVYIFVNGATTGGEPNDPTNVRAYIPIGQGQTLQSIYTVPLGKTAFILGLESSLTKGLGATAVSGIFTGRVRDFGKVFRTQDVFALSSTGASQKTYNFPVPLQFNEKSDFLPRVEVSSNGVGASWAYTLLLINN